MKKTTAIAHTKPSHTQRYDTRARKSEPVDAVVVEPETPQVSITLRPCAPLALAERPDVTFLAMHAEGASRDTMRRSLSMIARLCGAELETMPWWLLTPAQAAVIRSRFQKCYAKSSANLHLSALRGVLKTSAQLGLLKYERLQQILPAMKSVAGETDVAGRALELKEIEALFKVCDASTLKGARDKLILVLLFGLGLRRASICEPDYPRSLRRGNSEILIHGKNNVVKWKRLTRQAFDVMEEYLAVRGKSEGPLICRLTPNGGFAEGRPNPDVIYDRVKKLAEMASIDSTSPHDFRRTFGTMLLDAGEDVFVVQKLMDHKQVSSTQRYDRRPEEVRLAALDRFHAKMPTGELIRPKKGKKR